MFVRETGYITLILYNAKLPLVYVHTTGTSTYTLTHIVSLSYVSLFRLAVGMVVLIVFLTAILGGLACFTACYGRKQR